MEKREPPWWLAKLVSNESQGQKFLSLESATVTFYLSERLERRHQETWQEAAGGWD